MKRNLLAVVALALAGLVGCVSAQTFRSGTGKLYPHAKPVDVLVFYAVEDVKRPYEVIGEITTSASSGWGIDEGELIEKAREEAARLGASAILVQPLILVRPLDKGTGGDRALAVLFRSSDKTQHMTAIRFTDLP